jgi:hypothetical protein
MLLEAPKHAHRLARPAVLHRHEPPARQPATDGSRLRYRVGASGGPCSRRFSASCRLTRASRLLCGWAVSVPKQPGDYGGWLLSTGSGEPLQPFRVFASVEPQPVTISHVVGSSVRSITGVTQRPPSVRPARATRADRTRHSFSALLRRSWWEAARMGSPVDVELVQRKRRGPSELIALPDPSPRVATSQAEVGERSEMPPARPTEERISVGLLAEATVLALRCLGPWM